MKVIRPSDYQTMPWKNGGGLTHEILKLERDGRMFLRLSIAEVTSDGPFSTFTGLTRILTVIDGGGLQLAAPDHSFQVAHLAPFTFSGDTPINSTRLDGDVRDFNVIFDPAVVSSTVSVIAPTTTLVLTGRHQHNSAILFLEKGEANRQAVLKDSLIWLESGDVKATSASPMIVADFIFPN